MTVVDIMTRRPIAAVRRDYSPFNLLPFGSSTLTSPKLNGLSIVTFCEGKFTLYFEGQFARVRNTVSSVVVAQEPISTFDGSRTEATQWAASAIDAFLKMVEGGRP